MTDNTDYWNLLEESIEYETEVVERHVTKTKILMVPDEVYDRMAEILDDRDRGNLCMPGKAKRISYRNIDVYKQSEIGSLSEDMLSKEKP